MTEECRVLCGACGGAGRLRVYSAEFPHEPPVLHPCTVCMEKGWIKGERVCESHESLTEQITAARKTLETGRGQWLNQP